MFSDTISFVHVKYWQGTQRTALFNYKKKIEKKNGVRMRQNVRSLFSVASSENSCIHFITIFIFTREFRKLSGLSVIKSDNFISFLWSHCTLKKRGQRGQMSRFLVLKGAKNRLWDCEITEVWVVMTLQPN